MKHKARLCAHGGMQQHDINYWDTYSPVVNWLSIRLMLIVSIILGLHTRSIDFTLAFPQADLEVPIYMELPMGYNVPGARRGDYVLKLKKSLYGLKQAGLNCHDHLSAGLTKRGFVQTPVDPCVWLKRGIIVLVYVDDCLIFLANKELADEFIQSLKKDYLLTDERDFSSYLGVKVTKDAHGSILLNQPFLVDRIINGIKFDDKEVP